MHQSGTYRQLAHREKLWSALRSYPALQAQHRLPSAQMAAAAKTVNTRTLAHYMPLIIQLYLLIEVDNTPLGNI
jgi:hypothetical protein